MKKLTVWIACIAIMLVTANAALAQGRGGGSKAGKTTGPAVTAKGGGKTTTHAPTTTTTMKGPKSSPASTMKGPKNTQGSTATTTRGGKGAAMTKADAAKSKQVAKTDAAKSKTKSATTANSTSTSETDKSRKTATTTSSGSETTLTPVQQKLERNTNLASKLESRLPKGTDLMDAAEGFRNLGQFVAAVNASHNHELDFAKLKTAMVDDGMSLGQAMKEQRSTLDGADAMRVQRDADALVQSTEGSSTPAARRPKTRTKDTQ